MDSEESLIIRCKQLSVNIREYFDGMMYLGEVSDASEITPVYLNRLAVSMIMSEVADIGIVSEFDIDDFVTDPINFEALFAIREKLNAEILYEYFKNMTNEQYATLCDVLDGCSNDNDLLLDLINYICQVSPLDLKLGQILQCTSHWVSTSRFRQHLDALRRKMDNTDQNKTNITDDNIDDIAAFLQLLKRREEVVIKAVKYLLELYTDLKEDVLLKKAMRYDYEKLNPDELPVFANYTLHEDQYTKEPECVTNHHETVDHHKEYWLKRRADDKVIQFTKEHGVLMVLSLMLDNLSVSDIKTEINLLKPVIPNNMLSFMYTLVDHHYANLMEVLRAAIE